MPEFFRSGIFKSLANVDNALTLIVDSVVGRTIKVERVDLAKSAGHILGEDIVARVNLPSVDRSIVDGYAVRVGDTKNASTEFPVSLNLVGESVLGRDCTIAMKANETIAVATGSIMPKGADAVVPIEDSTPLSDDVIGITLGTRVGQNVVRKGADLGPGKLVLSKGRRLRPEDVGVLKALGIERVKVRVLSVGIMSTGNELTDSVKKSKGKIVDINRLVLGSMVAELGSVPVDLGIIPDREDVLLKALRMAIRSCDMVIVTGGSSVGKRDLVPRCINKLGKPGMLVHGVAMRPSMPTGFGIVDHTPIMSLPGVPVSAVFAFRVFGRPLIAKLLDAGEIVDPVLEARLVENIRGVSGYRTLVRVIVKKTERGLIAEPLKTQSSSIFMSIVAANGYVTLQERESELKAGDTVKVTLIGELR
ncbi:MAG TPA: gephyrin-like molybdotransferase Glp [Candidatus Bathyarchaeia archaeon]|nr:gephyrin-like molybdotransferase Glp [Candidatus Bathyarchaeia archaeon]